MQRDSASALALPHPTAVEELNPCVTQLPPIPTKAAAMLAMTRGRVVRRGHTSEGATRHPDDLLLASAELADLLIDVVTNVHESFVARNLNSPEFRQFATSASEYVNHATNLHGHALPRPAINLPGAKPRGILAVAQARMGRRTIANAICDYIGLEPRPITVRVNQHVIAYWHLPTLRVSWSAKGSRRKFVKDFLEAFDFAMKTSYSTQARGPFHRDEQEVGSALRALAVAANVGLLIVERVNTRDAMGDEAAALWDTLGKFTRMTGIPVLCLVTPGAAAALAEQSSAAGELAVDGAHIVVPAERSSRKWAAASVALWDAYLRRETVPKAPLWFPDALWDVTHGLYGLATKVCAYIDSRLNDAEFAALSEGRFREFAAAALALEQPHLDILKRLQSPGRFTVTSLRRHGDWLPLKSALATVPRLALERDAPTIAG